MINDEKNPVAGVIDKFLKGRFSGRLTSRFYLWLLKEDNKDLKEEALMNSFDSYDIPADDSVQDAFAKVKARLGIEKEARKISLQGRLAQVAAVFLPLVIAAGSYIYLNKPEAVRDKAITGTVERAEVNVPYGKNKHLYLPDSSEVWINAGSSLRYPGEFTGDKRTVELEGEAYFSVKTNKAKPFVVQTRHLDVVATGTEFNVRAYPGQENHEVTLNCGLVTVESRKEEKKEKLSPGEQLVYNKNTTMILVKEVVASEVSGWKNGEIRFTDNHPVEIFKTLERHYNVSFHIGDSFSNNEVYSFKVNPGENIEDVMNIMKELAGNLKYRIENNTIIIE